MLTTNYIKFIV